MSHNYSYDSFWKKMLPSLPLSKGAIRVPIVTKTVRIPGLDIDEAMSQLHTLLQQIIETHSNTEGVKNRMIDAGDESLLPLITDEFTGVVRFDCIWQELSKSLKILEINCDYPDGLILHDKTISVLTNKITSCHSDLLSLLFSNTEDVAVLHPLDSNFMDGYHAEHEWLSGVVNSSVLTHDPRTLKPNTTIRRCLETTKLKPTTIKSLVRGNHRLINTISLRTIGYKQLLQDITHHYVPQTKTLTKGLINFAKDRQNHLVLKPANGCEGFGVTFGKNVTKHEWERLIISNINSVYVLQEYVDLPKITVSMFENGQILEKELYYDLCPHFFIKNKEVIGAGHILMRFSENPIVNVAQGGGIGYYDFDPYTSAG